MVSPGVLEPESLASLFCLFNWRCLIKIFVESVCIICPSKNNKEILQVKQKLIWNKDRMFILDIFIHY